MKNKEFELRKSTIDDFRPMPEVYQNAEDGFGDLTIFSNYGMLYPEGEEGKPIYYFRHSNIDSVRWAGMIHLGDGPLAPQREAHVHDLAQNADRTTVYARVSEQPEIWAFRGIDKEFEIAYYEDGSATWKEGKDGCILNIKAEPFPYALFTHKKSVMRAPIWLQQCLLSGTYEGKPVKGMGGFDRTFLSDHQGQESLWAAGCTIYFSNIYSGIREDGRRECFFGQISVNQNDYGVAYYYIDGEEPVVSDKLHLEAQFHHLPYAPGDPTVVYTDAVFTFADKEIHFHGKWGAKGFTATPRIEKLGQSHCFGEWYEGKTPYRHVLSHTFSENMGCLDESVIAAGYKVVD